MSCQKSYAQNAQLHGLFHRQFLYSYNNKLLILKGEVEVTRRRGRRRKKLLDDLKDRRRYYHLKEEALDRTMWRNHFGRGVGPVVFRQITEWMNELILFAGLLSSGYDPLSLIFPMINSFFSLRSYITSTIFCRKTNRFFVKHSYPTGNKSQ